MKIKAKIIVREDEYHDKIVHVPMTGSTFIIVPSRLVYAIYENPYSIVFYKCSRSHNLIGEVWPTTYSCHTVLRRLTSGIWVDQGYDNNFLKSLNLKLIV